MTKMLAVSVLQNKKRDLLTLQDELLAQLSEVARGILSVNICLAMFDPEAAEEPLPLRHRRSKTAFAYGELLGLIVDVMKAAQGPVTHKELITAIEARVGPRPGLLDSLREALRRLRKQRLVEQVGAKGRTKMWAIVGQSARKATKPTEPPQTPQAAQAALGNGDKGDAIRDPHLRLV